MDRMPEDYGADAYEFEGSAANDGHERSHVMPQQPMIQHKQPADINDVSEIKRRLKLIFNYYSSYGDRLNVCNLKSSKFHKIMQDSMILQDSTNLMEKKKLDLLFCQVNKHKPNMQFDQFL